MADSVMALSFEKVFKHRLRETVLKISRDVACRLGRSKNIS